MIWFPSPSVAFPVCHSTPMQLSFISSHPLSCSLVCYRTFHRWMSFSIFRFWNVNLDWVLDPYAGDIAFPTVNWNISFSDSFNGFRRCRKWIFYRNFPSENRNIESLILSVVTVIAEIEIWWVFALNLCWLATDSKIKLKLQKLFIVVTIHLDVKLINLSQSSKFCFVLGIFVLSNETTQKKTWEDLKNTNFMIIVK